MDDTTNAQTRGKHVIVDSLDREFARLHLRSRTIIESTPADILYASGGENDPESRGNASRSVGESVLRSAAAIEQTFGGITSNLWDDPFEWTLPEYLSTPVKVVDHLEEVEAVRRRAFSSFADDGCLLKRVATPSQDTNPLIGLLLDTLVRASFFQSQAAATLKNLSGISTVGFII
ncbi:MAG: hypothetical protein H7Z16_06175 [Pyrinomonadaceae bacterium]|nr:hypothetical protein [Pyrinomonadaceae bacterium]